MSPERFQKDVENINKVTLSDGRTVEIGLPDFLEQMADQVGADKQRVLQWYQQQVSNFYDQKKDGLRAKIKLIVPTILGAITEAQIQMLRNSLEVEEGRVSRKCQELDSKKGRRLGEIEERRSVKIQKINNESARAETICREAPTVIRRIKKNEAIVIRENEVATKKAEKTIGGIFFGFGIGMGVVMSDVADGVVFTGDLAARTVLMGIKESGLAFGVLGLNALANIDKNRFFYYMDMEDKLRNKAAEVWKKYVNGIKKCSIEFKQNIVRNAKWGIDKVTNYRIHD